MLAGRGGDQDVARHIYEGHGPRNTGIHSVRLPIRDIADAYHAISLPSARLMLLITYVSSRTRALSETNLSHTCHVNLSSSQSEEGHEENETARRTGGPHH